MKERKKESKKKALDYKVFSIRNESQPYMAWWHDGTGHEYQMIDVAKFKEMDLYHRSHFGSVLSGLFNQS